MSPRRSTVADVAPPCYGASVSPPSPGLLAWKARAKQKPPPIASADAAAAVLVPLLTAPDGEPLEVERVAALGLDSGGRLVAAEVLFSGGVNLSLIDSTYLFRWALTRQAPVLALILGHNHPSGDLTPSSEDLRITQQVAAGCTLLGLSLLDHLIVGDGVYQSLAALGEVPRSRRSIMPAR